MYILYISVMININPKLGPPLPEAERITTREKVKLLKNMFAPMVLVTVVLGIIFAGIVSSTRLAEARRP